MAVSFIDIKKAFDSVYRASLWNVDSKARKAISKGEYVNFKSLDFAKSLE